MIQDHDQYEKGPDLGPSHINRNWLAFAPTSWLVLSPILTQGNVIALLGFIADAADFGTPVLHEDQPSCIIVSPATSIWWIREI